MAQDSTIDLGQRRLAAIIFTDVVGFSARIQEDETGTLQLVERDTQFIKNVCTSFNGRILKSTGDGLLIFFDSAVDAVAAALKIQEEFGQQKTTAAPHEVLEHRIGIHLGDVFIRDGDVMGDGVNIAARLQQIAEPGGICISQTVYEVVKNKLSLHVTSLGPRELKNIREAVPAYQVLLDAQKALSRPSGGYAGGNKTFSVPLLFAVVGVFVLLVIAGGAWYVLAKKPVETKAISRPVTEVAKAAPAPAVSELPPVVSTPTAPLPPTSTIAEKAPVPSAPISPPTSTVFPMRSAPSAEETTPSPEPPIAPAPPARALQMSARWIQGEMLRYNKSNPLKIQPPPRLAMIATNMPPTTSWLEGTTLHFDVGGKDTPSDLSRAAPIVLEYVLYSLTQAVGQDRTPEPIRRIFGGGPPPGGPDSSGQQAPPMPPEGGMGPGGHE